MVRGDGRRAVEEGVESRNAFTRGGEDTRFVEAVGSVRNTAFMSRSGRTRQRMLALAVGLPKATYSWPWQNTLSRRARPTVSSV